MRKAYPLHLLLLAFLLIIGLPSFAQTASEGVLTNAGVSKMLKGGLPESIIIREIQLSRTSFDTSPTGLVDLRKHGASEAVLHAVLDSWGSGGMPLPAALPDGGGAMPGAYRQSPHMPSFQADVRVNKKTHTKVSMGHNHIEVQGTGVPSVSVQWQTNPPDR